jgi:uncharacterized damage-inducible protein DinB
VERKAVTPKEHIMANLIADAAHEFRRHKDLVDRGIINLSDEQFFRPPGEQVNSIALIVKHLAGNLLSRWTEFLTSDGEKSTRNRDSEFEVTPDDTRESLLAAWELGWSALFNTLNRLTDADLDKTVTIRGEPHRVQQALLRGLEHAAYHTGQIVYLVRLVNPSGEWLTIAPGKSSQHRPGYLQSK